MQCLAVDQLCQQQDARWSRSAVQTFQLLIIYVNNGFVSAVNKRQSRGSSVSIVISYGLDD
jgi:hypothetical protein